MFYYLLLFGPSREHFGKVSKWIHVTSSTVALWSNNETEACLRMLTVIHLDTHPGVNLNILWRARPSSVIARVHNNMISLAAFRL
jgi:hypothetical protein